MSKLDPYKPINPKFNKFETRCYQVFRKFFAIDLRSLAMMRIGLGILLLADLWVRSRNLTVHYTDMGWFPRHIISSFYFGQYKLSLHMLGGSFGFQLMLFMVAAFFAVLMIIGFYTRISSFISLILLVSLHYRLPVVLQSGDNLLSIMLFWTLFLPTGAMWSFDSFNAKNSKKIEEYRFFNMACSALILQVSLVYIVTSAHKYVPEWWSQGTALYYSLHLDLYTTPFGQWFRDQFISLLFYMTKAVYLFELLIGFVLILIPIPIVRLLAVAAVVFFHLNIFMMMRVGLFPFISICAMIPLIPSLFWDKVVPVKFLSFFDCSKWLKNKKPSVYHFRYGIIQAVFVLLCLFLVIQWNLSRFEQTKFLTAKTYRYTYKITAYLHLEQFWNMFSPPPATDGWYFLEGVGAQNNKVDVWNNKKEISINTKPKNVAKQYKTQRDRKFWETVVSGNKRYLRSISNYFCHKWNDDHNEKLLYIRTYYITEYPPPPFEKSDYELRRTSQMIMAYPCQYSFLPNIRR